MEATSRSVPADDQDGIVLPLSAWRPGRAVEAALRHEVVTLNVPLVGRVTLPGRDHLVWYAGLATFAALEIVDWPVALLMAAAKALSDSHHHELLREFGAALETGA